MRQISAQNRKIIAADPFYRKCARAGEGTCRSKHITIDHAVIVAGRQLDDLWSLIPLCTWHHAVNEFQDSGDLDKEMNLHIALSRATNEEILAISKVIPYTRERIRLNEKYGAYEHQGPNADEFWSKSPASLINY